MAKIELKSLSKSPAKHLLNSAVRLSDHALNYFESIGYPTRIKEGAVIAIKDLPKVRLLKVADVESDLAMWYKSEFWRLV